MAGLTLGSSVTSCRSVKMRDLRSPSSSYHGDGRGDVERESIVRNFRHRLAILHTTQISHQLILPNLTICHEAHLADRGSDEPALLHSSSSLQQRAQPSQQTNISNSALVATHHPSLTTLQLGMAFDSIAVQ